MPVLAAGKVERIEFCEQRTETWNTNAVAMGSSTTAVTAWAALVSQARDAYNAQKIAQDAAKDATITFNQAVDAMTVATADIIKSVKTKAAVSGDAIYALASIPVPAAPSPKAPPGQPTDLVVSLTQTGALEMKFKCVNPVGTSGTIYNIFRYAGGGVPTDADYLYIGGTGVKEFTDASAPAGVPLIMYKIQAVRSTAVGAWATFNVFMGVNSGGLSMVQKVVNTSNLAA